MSKLDDILKPVATLDPVAGREIKKLDIKILILEIFGDALKEAETFSNLGDAFRQKVEEL